MAYKSLCGRASEKLTLRSFELRFGWFPEKCEHCHPRDQDNEGRQSPRRVEPTEVVVASKRGHEDGADESDTECSANLSGGVV